MQITLPAKFTVSFDKASLCFVIFLLAILQRAGDPNSTLHNFSFLLYLGFGLYFFGIFFKHSPQLRQVKHNPWYLLLIFLLVVSSFWSLSFHATFKNSLFLLVSSMYAYYLFQKFDLTEFLKTILIGLSIVIGLSLLVIFIFPEKAIHTMSLHHGAWKGIYFHKSGFGRETVVAAIIGLFLLKRPFNLIYFAFCLFVVFKTQAMISVICLLLTLAYYLHSLVLGKIKGFKKYSVWIFVFGLIAAALVIYNNLPLFLSLINKDMSFNGRTPIWLFSIYSIGQNPFFGHGYSTFWDNDKLSNYTTWDIPHAHNHFLDVGLDIGIVGLAIFFLILYRLSKNLLLFQKTQKKLFDISFLSILSILIISCTENSIYQPFNLIWIYFSAIVIYAENLAERGFEPENSPIRNFSLSEFK